MATLFQIEHAQAEVLADYVVRYTYLDPACPHETVTE